MTGSVGPRPAAGDVSVTRVFVRAATAEWTRLRTLRSTWFCLVAACVLMFLIGAAAGSGHTGPEPAPIWKAAQTAMVPAQFVFLLVVLFAATGEYATGAIRSTLQWVPNRAVLVVARAAVPVAFVTASAVGASGLTGLVAWAFLGSEAEIDAGDIATSLGVIALAVSFGGLLAVGLGLLLRNTPGTLTAMFLLLFVLVVTLGNSAVPWMVTISDHLPGRAVVSMLVTDDDELPRTTTALVMIGWTVASLTAGSWSLLRRDPP
jgi:hypothetical protein